MFDDAKSDRLAMAAALIELAEHSSEAELRSSLSRLYYALYHVARELTGISDHGQLPTALDVVHPNLGSEFKLFRDLRARADYNPNFSKTFGSGSEFRAATLRSLDDGRKLYEQLLELCKEQ
jgi:hypothetical protein